MSLAGSFGDLIGLALTPFIILEYEHIPRMNIIWFVPAAIGFCICVFKVFF